MTHPFFDTDKAFEVFFDETVSFNLKAGGGTTLKACVFARGTGDPISDGMMDTEREDMSFVFREVDWPFVKSLKRGDTVQRCRSQKKYAVSQVKFDDVHGWVVDAREI